MRIYINEKEREAIKSWFGAPKSLLQKLGVGKRFYRLTPNGKFVFSSEDCGPFYVEDHEKKSKLLSQLEDRMRIDKCKRPDLEFNFFDSVESLISEHPGILSVELADDGLDIRKKNGNLVSSEKFDPLVDDDDFGDEDLFD